MAERTTVRLPEDLVRRAEHKAAEQCRSLTALIEEDLRNVVDESTPTQAAARVLPRVSAAKGGLLPGINLDDHSLQEAEDPENVRRFF